MKKYLLIILLFICSILLVGCSKEKVSIDKKYIGTWKLVEEVKTKDGDNIPESTFIFKEDGTCFFSYTLEPRYSTIGLVGDADGECFLNSSNNKFKMEGDGSIYKEWTDFKDNGTTITIDGWEYEKSN